jgi:hypothetical protein
VDLDRQLAGGDDDQGLGDLAAVGDPLQQRDAEGEGLAGARAGLADDVLAAERDGERQGLDREGREDALRGEGVCYLGDDPEVGEGSQDVQPP